MIRRRNGKRDRSKRENNHYQWQHMSLPVEVDFYVVINSINKWRYVKWKNILNYYVIFHAELKWPFTYYIAGEEVIHKLGYHDNEIVYINVNKMTVEVSLEDLTE